MSEISLELKNIKKSFQEGEDVLESICLTAKKGEFVTLLGSSGCGKTTTLRIIAGLEQPDSGQVFLDGKDVTSLEPNQRNVNTVFQNYALFPHMNVADNIGYGLKLKKTSKAEISRRVKEMLELVQLPGFERRKPSELSGGQRQRVAIARALVNNPEVLLLDEPLSNLDAKLRVKMREEIREIQKKYEITMVFVTHDQEEAMVLGDQIAIMDQGKLVQIGKPEEVYLHPQNDFARDFLGISNRFTDIHGNTICCRPEELEFAAEGSVKGIVRQEEFLGFYRQYYVETMNHEHIIVRTDRNIKVEEGKEVQLRVK